MEFLKKYAGYFFGVLSMISLAFICGELNKGQDILSEEELNFSEEDSIDNMEFSLDDEEL